MTTTDLTPLFPTDLAEIPAQYRIEPIHQREYLLNGDMKPWTGKVAEVYSPVCVPDEAGNLQRQLVGSFPVAGPEEAMAALDAAVAAYDNGRGEWPQMAV
ncbi:MAG TPA: NADP-dependent glyceraldehyde-3-phosphate dehydrogenase, partial [Fibrella sp.]